MKDEKLNPVSLRWKNTSTRLSAETDGQPAEQILMKCQVGTGERGGIRWERAVALWDSGTSTTVISPGIAKKLGLEPDWNYYANLNGVGGTVKAWMTVVCIGFPNGKAWGPMEVAVRELPTFDILLGMDVISIGKFVIERKPDGGTRFTFDF